MQKLQMKNNKRENLFFNLKKVKGGLKNDFS
jgi:hypothetical protein